MRLRVTDSGRARLRKLGVMWARYGRDTVVALSVGLAAFAVLETESSVKKIEKIQVKQARIDRQARVEQRMRINENCRIFEQRNEDDVERLIATYRYLAKLDPEEFGERLNREVIANLPRTINEAQTDDAPSYCDEPGVEAEHRGEPPVGLPEPDPEVPDIPPKLKQYIEP